MGMSMHDRYYEPEDDDYADQLEEQIFDCMKRGEHYDPTDLSNFSEAMCESVSNKDLQDFMRDCVDRKDWEALGRKLHIVAYEYMESCAEYHLTK